MDDWTVEAPADPTAHAINRSVSNRAGAPADRVAALAEQLEAATDPVIVAGPDIDASGGWDHAVALAEKQHLPVWAIPAPGGGRLGFPENHPLFKGVLPPAIGPAAETLAGHDLILVAGASVFSYYPYIPGDLLPDGAALVAITSDPDEAARAPMGDAIVADVALTLEALVAALGDTERAAPERREGPMEPPESEPISGTEAMATLAGVFPEDGIVVLEAPSSTLALRNQLRLSRPGSYYFGAGGGLGFGLAAAVGVQLAEPNRQVVCVVGEGSAQYAITAFWSAAAYDVPVKFCVLRNSEYAILKWFSLAEGVEGAPGLDLPALDVAAVAAGYGVPSLKVEGAEQLRDGLEQALAADGPALVEVGVAPGMWLG
ncbi:MAG: benzoylformate decarboxylase [Thermoleophilia bacterium]|nr:benzoylformate decarboxylase [Thermoleophilia bacterium]